MRRDMGPSFGEGGGEVKQEGAFLKGAGFLLNEHDLRPLSPTQSPLVCLPSMDAENEENGDDACLLMSYDSQVFVYY
jgi:hypothetical protein